jgi:hypothetical protein
MQENSDRIIVETSRHPLEGVTVAETTLTT